jgi:hypothetical protein
MWLKIHFRGFLTNFSGGFCRVRDSTAWHGTSALRYRCVTACGGQGRAWGLLGVVWRLGAGQGRAGQGGAQVRESAQRLSWQPVPEVGGA